MYQNLNIRIIAASSPQAKGRVERNHGTHQDRLIKKMRRKGIDSYETANEYLENEICRTVLRGRPPNRKTITGGSRRRENFVRSFA